MEFEGIDLKRVVNIYPCVVVRHGEETTTISFEWFDENSQNVEKVGYGLIFIGVDGDKRELFFSTYEKMLEAMEEIASKLQQPQ